MTPLEALYRCQRAWEQSQPQLFFELWPDDGLDEPQPSALRFVEPAACLPTSPGGGLEPRLTAGEARLKTAGTSDSPAVSLVLNPGAEPWHAHTGRPANARVSPPARSGGSAPLINQTAPGRRSPQGTRGQGQRGGILT